MKTLLFFPLKHEKHILAIIFQIALYLKKLLDIVFYTTGLKEGTVILLRERK